MPARYSSLLPRRQNHFACQTLVPRRENGPIAGFRGPGLVPGRPAAAPVDPPAAPVDAPVDPPAAPLDAPVDPVDVRRASRGRRRRRKTCKPQWLPR